MAHDEQIESLLAQARTELEKVGKIMTKYNRSEKDKALKKSLELEEEQEPLANPQDFLEEQHTFSDYERSLQGMLSPIDKIIIKDLGTHSKKKAYRSSKNPKHAVKKKYKKAKNVNRT